MVHSSSFFLGFGFGPSPEQKCLSLVRFMDGGYLFWMVVGLSQTGTWTKSLNENAASSTTCKFPKGTENDAAEERHA